MKGVLIIILSAVAAADCKGA